MPQNYFELFQLPLAFEIDLEALDQKYYQLIAAAHPDFPSNSKISAETVNQGYKLLQNNYGRLRHLLEMTVGFQPEISITDPEFLMQFLQYQDELESSALNASQIVNMKQSLKHAKRKIIDDVIHLRSVGNIEDASYEFAKLKFYIRIIDRINELEDEADEAI